MLFRSPPSPSLGPPDCHLHDASQSPDVRFARVSISGHHFRCLEVWSPAEHPWEGIMGESGRPGLPGPTQDHLEPLNHLWQRPAGPTRAASPRSPILTSMFLLRKKLPADEEEHSMSPAPSSQPLTTLPSPSPSSHHLTILPTSQRLTIHPSPSPNTHYHRKSIPLA